MRTLSLWSWDAVYTFFNIKQRWHCQQSLKGFDACSLAWRVYVVQGLDCRHILLQNISGGCSCIPIQKIFWHSILKMPNSQVHYCGPPVSLITHEQFAHHPCKACNMCSSWELCTYTTHTIKQWEIANRKKKWWYLSWALHWHVSLPCTWLQKACFDGTSKNNHKLVVKIGFAQAISNVVQGRQAAEKSQQETQPAIDSDPSWHWIYIGGPKQMNISCYLDRFLVWATRSKGIDRIVTLHLVCCLQLSTPSPCTFEHE